MPRRAIIISEDNYLTKNMESNEYHLSTFKDMATHFNIEVDEISSFNLGIKLTSYGIVVIQEEGFKCIIYLPENINSYQKNTIIKELVKDSSYYPATSKNINVLYYPSMNYDQIIEYINNYNCLTKRKI